MRCIETEKKEVVDFLLNIFNLYMRCIETLDLKAVVELCENFNLYMRCIETLIKATKMKLKYF